MEAQQAGMRQSIVVPFLLFVDFVIRFPTFWTKERWEFLIGGSMLTVSEQMENRGLVDCMIREGLERRQASGAWETVVLD